MFSSTILTSCSPKTPHYKAKETVKLYFSQKGFILKSCNCENFLLAFVFMVLTILFANYVGYVYVHVDVNKP